MEYPKSETPTFTKFSTYDRMYEIILLIYFKAIFGIKL